VPSTWEEITARNEKGGHALSEEGDSKTLLSLVFPPSGNQSSSDVVSGERGLNRPS